MPNWRADAEKRIKNNPKSNLYFGHYFAFYPANIPPVDLKIIITKRYINNLNADNNNHGLLNEHSFVESFSIIEERDQASDNLLNRTIVITTPSPKIAISLNSKLMAAELDQFNNEEELKKAKIFLCNNKLELLSLLKFINNLNSFDSEILNDLAQFFFLNPSQKNAQEFIKLFTVPRLSTLCFWEILQDPILWSNESLSRLPDDILLNFPTLLTNPIKRHGFQISKIKCIEVCNSLEATKFIYIHLSNQSAPDNFYEMLLEKITKTNGKYYLIFKNEVVDGNGQRDSRSPASAILDKINQVKPVHPNELASYFNLLFADLGKDLQQYTAALPQNYTLSILRKESTLSIEQVRQCRAVSEFQINTLEALRPSLTDKELHLKRNERYGYMSLLQKTKASDIAIFIASRENAIVATLVVNAHSAENTNLIGDRIVFVSDLFLHQDLIGDHEFAAHFVSSTFKKIKAVFPKSEFATLLAPEKPEDPLIKCLTHLVSVGICQRLDYEQQTKLGLVPYFVNHPSQTLANQPTIQKDATSEGCSAFFPNNQGGPDPADGIVQPKGTEYAKH